jgi:hypothetical protein
VQLFPEGALKKAREPIRVVTVVVKGQLPRPQDTPHAEVMYYSNTFLRRWAPAAHEDSSSSSNSNSRAAAAGGELALSSSYIS